MGVCRMVDSDSSELSCFVLTSDVDLILPMHLYLIII
jgi:hypothetical protein